MTNGFAGFQESPDFGERVASFTLAPDVNVLVNAPAESAFARDKKVLLIIYTLPNGNTIPQTIGRKTKASDDWHFDIQHIGAQTRFLRAMLPERTIVVACLESKAPPIPQSWPKWREKNGDVPIPGIVGDIRNIFADDPVDIALAGHSGGGSFIFGYLNAVDKIPDDIKRLAFLDSDYAYSRARGHTDKLSKWLDASNDHYLCVLAYNDAAALYEGKPFVSAQGGTWGRSHAMMKDLGEHFTFTQKNMGLNLEKYSALGGRIEFLLRDNPEKKIFHTIQVERNGFIQTMVSGTTNEGNGYTYFGERAYGKWIQER